MVDLVAERQRSAAPIRSAYRQGGCGFLASLDEAARHARELAVVMSP